MPKNTPVLESQIQTSSPEFKSNAEYHRGLAKELAQAEETVRQGNKESREKHTSRGKLYVRDRVSKLLDAGSPFMELSPLAANGMYEGASPGAGIVTGVGIVNGREVMVVANDA